MSDQYRVKLADNCLKLENQREALATLIRLLDSADALDHDQEFIEGLVNLLRPIEQCMGEVFDELTDIENTLSDQERREQSATDSKAAAA